MGCVIGYDVPKEGIMIECPVCNGLGHLYQLFDIATREISECTENEYWLFPETEDEAYDCGMPYCRMPLTFCQNCNGSGKIERDY